MMTASMTSLLILLGTAVHSLILPQNSLNILDTSPKQLPDLEVLLKELLAEATPIGKPFPSIKGPKKNDKVCIVGAGPAGISMAQSLKKRGFSKLTIFESSGRVGGKTSSLDVNGVANSPFALGADYFTTLIPLAKEYDAADLVPIKWGNMWKTDYGSQKLTLQEFMIQSVMNDTGVHTPAEAISRFIEDVRKYNNFYRDTFGSRQGGLFLRPNQTTLFRIRGTITEFLKRESMEALQVSFRQFLTLPGYGYIEQIGALYGLMWLQPSFFASAIYSILGIFKEPFNAFILKDGFPKVWTNIVRKEKFDIRYNSKVISIRRVEDKIHLRIDQTPERTEECCDFLVWTGTGPQLFNALEDMSKKEHILLGSLKSDFQSVTWINMKNELRNGPFSGYVSSVDPKNDDSLVSWEINASGWTRENLERQQEEAWSANNSSPDVKMVGTVGQQLGNNIELEDSLRNHYENLNATIVDFIHHAHYDYFNRWSPKSLNMGPHWEVFDLQGERNMWYAGSSFCFETVHNVMAYNNLLLQQSGIF